MKRFESPHLALTAITSALALHVLLVLFTGGYSFKAYGITIAGHDITLPIILLLGLVILRLSVGHRSLCSAGFVSHDAAILFSAFLIIYLANGRTIWSGDTLPARYLPLSILRDGNFDLDEFPFLFDRDKFPYPRYLRLVNGHYVSDYPVGAALLAIPFYLPSALGHVDPQSSLVEDLEKLSAAVIVALSAVVLYLALRRLTSRSGSLLVTALYALGTSSLSESSQALWQHGASQLALTAALYCLVRGRTEGGWVAFAGFPLAFAVISRPTDVLLALPLGIYVLVHHRRHVWGFLLGALAPGFFQLWYNAVYFGDPFRVQFFFTLSTAVRGLPLGAEAWSTPFWKGLAGILLSPGRGLFIYSPVFLLSVLGIGLAWRRNGDLLLRYASPGVFLTIVVYSKWGNWWGGASYGPRLLADLSPVLALCLYPVSAMLRSRRALKAALIILAAWSVGAHSIGAFVDDRSWNGSAEGDYFLGRLWSWTDNQLVNPPREAFTRAVIATLRLPTSRTAPALLSAFYRTDSAPTLTTSDCKAIEISVNATNDGRAVWLAQSKRDEGVVRLGWRWYKGDQSLSTGEGRVPLSFSVLPGQSYEFRASIVAPPAPSTYLLEVGLVSERVTWFSERGSPPIRIAVTVDAAPTLPEQADAFLSLLEQLRVLADDSPSFALSVDRPRYGARDLLRLSFAGSVGERSGRVDAYLLLRGPGGTLWFYDGRRLVRGGDCRWTPLARAVYLQRGRTSFAPLLNLPLAGMPPGAYTWHLLLTEVERYRIIASAQTNFEVIPPVEPAKTSP